ncbi:MAG: hypothetical protein WCW40_12235 [Bacteroidota bacterium]
MLTAISIAVSFDASSKLIGPAVDVENDFVTAAADVGLNHLAM